MWNENLLHHHLIECKECEKRINFTAGNCAYDLLFATKSQNHPDKCLPGQVLDGQLHLVYPLKKFVKPLHHHILKVSIANQTE